MKFKIIFYFYTLFALTVCSSFANDPLIEGEITLYELDLAPMSELDLEKSYVQIFNLKFPIFISNNNKSFSLISVPLGISEGEYPLTIFKGDKKIAELKNIAKARKELDTKELLNTPEVNVLPKKMELVQRVAEEDIELKKKMTSLSSTKLWNDKFIPPVKVKINSHFGIYRVYSKHLRRRTHWGVDYHTPIGTKVRASSDGIVTVAKNYYFPGKTILIDHGKGLFTGYSHLSKMHVRPGDVVKMGQVIGLSGRSGKVTGSHLHWFAVNSRVKFDPLSLLKINLKKVSK